MVTPTNDTMEFFDSLIYFRLEEFNDPNAMDREFLRALDDARDRAGTAFTVRHVDQYREGDPGAHGAGRAVDIRCSDSFNRWRIISALIASGFNRIGVYDRHIHVDNDPSKPERVLWWGKSS
jgi:hypothetical protein